MQDNEVKTEVVDVVETETVEVEEQQVVDVNPPKKKKFDFQKFWGNLKYDLKGFFVLAPWHISMILLMVPGLCIGLFMGSHITAIQVLPTGYDYTAFYLFALILIGCISIFNGVSFSSKRSTFHATFSIIISAILILFAILYIKDYMSYLFVRNYINTIQQSKLTSIIVSIVCVGISTVSNLAGSIMNFFFIDKTLEKE